VAFTFGTNRTASGDSPARVSNTRTGDTGTNELADDEPDVARTTAKPPRVAPAKTPTRSNAPADRLEYEPDLR